jgi:hypothetical protein
MSDCVTSVERPRNLRSKTTNDLYKVEGVHEQSPCGRRYGDLVSSFVAALGGEAALDEQTRMAVRRAGELVTAAEQERAKMLRGEPVDALALIRLDNNAARAVRLLALPERRGKRAGPSLAEHIAAKHPRKATPL